MWNKMQQRSLMGVAVHAPSMLVIKKYFCTTCVTGGKYSFVRTCQLGLAQAPRAPQG